MRCGNCFPLSYLPFFASVRERYEAHERRRFVACDAREIGFPSTPRLGYSLHDSSSRTQTGYKWPRLPQGRYAVRFQLQAVLAHAHQLHILGNRRVAALLADRLAVRSWQHGPKIILQHAVRTAHDLVSHDCNSHARGRNFTAVDPGITQDISLRLQIVPDSQEGQRGCSHATGRRPKTIERR